MTASDLRFLRDLAEKWRVPLKQLKRVARDCDDATPAQRVATLRRISSILHELFIDDDDGQVEYVKKSSQGFKSPWQCLLESAGGLIRFEEDLVVLKDGLEFCRELYPGHPYPHLALWNDLNGNDPKFKVVDPYGTECLIRNEVPTSPRYSKG